MCNRAEKTSNIYFTVVWGSFIEIFNSVERNSVWCVKLQEISPKDKYIYSLAHGASETQKYLMGKRWTEINIEVTFP